MSPVLFNSPAQFMQLNFPESTRSMILPGARLLPFGVDLIPLFLDALAGFCPLLPGLVSRRNGIGDVVHHALKVRNCGLARPMACGGAVQFHHSCGSSCGVRVS